MPNQNILTYASKVNNVQQVYYSPVVTLQPSNQILSSIYAFLAKVEPWPDEQNPPAPQQTQKYLKSVFNNMFVVKKLNSNNISPVVERIDWTAGTVYDYYQDDVDMFQRDQNGFLVKHFYVKNKYDQVFKCLWNVNGAPSTVEPYFEPGTYGSNNIFKGADGYKWKFLYTINSGLKLKFMDATWMPVLAGSNALSPIGTSAGYGNIDVINVLNGGSGYDPANSVITVSITGDGTGAAATAQVSNGAISDIIVTNSGQNYTYANVTISSALGSNSSLIGPVSPIGGHGYDPISELGCARVMFSVEFNASENGIIPTDVDYHQVGLLVNPVAKDSVPYAANGTIYKTTTDFAMAPGFGVYNNDEIIFQGSTLDTASFTARVLSFDPASNVIRLINTKGIPTTSAPVYGSDSKTARTLLSYSTPNFVAPSGYIVFLENRTGVQRSFDGIEQYKFVLSY